MEIMYENIEKEQMERCIISWDPDGKTHIYVAEKPRSRINITKWINIYVDGKFNWLQKKMWKIFFGMEISDLDDNKRED